jgi:predicted NBD/HSP70 family sugar kinase
MLSGGMSGEEVFAGASSGDSHAQSVVATFADWVAVGLASLTNICDPEVIVIGGGVVIRSNHFQTHINIYYFFKKILHSLLGF